MKPKDFSETGLSRSRLRIMMASGSVLVLLAGIGLTANSASAERPPNDDKITICHATGSEKNPFNSQTVDKDGLNGHGGDEFDIIPPYDGKPAEGNDKGYPSYPGLNWTSENQAIWGNGCNVVDPSPSPTPTETSSPTPTPTPTETSSPTPTPTPTETTPPPPPPAPSPLAGDETVSEPLLGLVAVPIADELVLLSGEEVVPNEEAAVPITAPELGTAPDAAVPVNQVPTVIPAGGGGEASGSGSSTQLPYLLLLLGGFLLAAWSGVRLLGTRN